MMRIYIKSPKILSSGQNIILEESKSRHTSLVMRKKSGDEVIIFNQESGEWLARVIDASPKGVVLAPTSFKGKSAEAKAKINLFFAPIKSFSSSFIVEKATEIGANSITPIITERTIVRKVNIDKMVASSIGAAEQCGRTSIPKIYNANHFLSEIDKKEGANNINIFSTIFSSKDIADENINNSERLRDITIKNKNGEVNYNIFVGPEGGFSDAEKNTIDGITKSFSQKNIKLGLCKNILRAETATISALSILAFFVHNA